MKKNDENLQEENFFRKPSSRRNFMRVAGLTTVSAGLVIAGCKNDDDPNPDSDPDPNNPDDPDAVNLGSGDVGVLNYAYALEQLEAAFYTQVVAGGYYAGASSEEKIILADLQKHEVAHREYFKAALGDGAIPDLEVDFSSIDFDNRDSVLTAAQTFEDLGVAAYNGAGKLIENADYLVTAGKIVSVEARHAAAIRDLMQPNTAYFAGDDQIDSDGLDKAMMPEEVITAADMYIVTNINYSGLPTA